MFIGEIPQEYLDAQRESEVKSACIPEWVLFSGASGKAKGFYMALAAYHQSMPEVNLTDDDLRELAREGSLRRVQQVLKELQDLGAIEVRKIGGRTDYVIHYAPPVGYTGPLSRAEFSA